MPERMSFLVDSSNSLLGSASCILNQIEDEGGKKDPNKFAYILVASASLESILNDGIVNWAYNTFPKDDYKRHATAFLAMSLRGKLDSIGYLTTKGKYITDNSSNMYQGLSKLISLRNEVAHSKDFFIEADVEFTNDSEGNRSMSLPHEVISKFEKSPLALSNEYLLTIYEYLYELNQTLKGEIQYESARLIKTI